MPTAVEPDPRADAAPPLRGGRYRLVEVLGEGGMAVVYRGIDTRLEVERAVKVLLPEMAARPRIRQRFDAEARTMARLTHPHIVAIQDVDAEDARVFLVMELLRGGNLWGWVERHGPMPARLAVDLTLPVLDALAFAHQSGVVHRDVKPQNVLLTHEGLPKLTDFGIARIEREDARTRTAAVMGTWTYMPPEQRKSAKDTDPRADLYAVGAMLWALVRGEDPPDLFAADLDPTLLDGLPEPLAAVVRGATRYQREERYGDALAMGSALLACRGDLPPLPPELEALGPAGGAAGAPLTRALRAADSAASLALPSRSAPPGSTPVTDPAPPAPSFRTAGPSQRTAAPSRPGPANTTLPPPSPADAGASPSPALAAVVGAAPQARVPPPGGLPLPGQGPSTGTMVPPADGTLSIEPPEPVAARGAAAAPPRSRLPLLAAAGLLVAVGASAALWWRGTASSPADPAVPWETASTPASGEPAAGEGASAPGGLPPVGDPGLPAAGEAPGGGPAAPAPGEALPARASAPPPPQATAPAATAPPPQAPASSASTAAGEEPGSATEEDSALAAGAAPEGGPAAAGAAPSPQATAADSSSAPAAPAASTAAPPSPTAPLSPPASSSAAAPSSAGSTSSGPPGRVTVTGQVTGATLVHQGTGKRYSPGEVPAGDYWLEVRFFGTDQAVRATTVRVISEYALTVRCQSRSRTCY